MSAPETETGPGVMRTRPRLLFLTQRGLGGKQLRQSQRATDARAGLPARHTPQCEFDARSLDAHLVFAYCRSFVGNCLSSPRANRVGPHSVQSESCLGSTALTTPSSESACIHSGLGPPTYSPVVRISQSFTAWLVATELSVITLGACTPSSSTYRCRLSWSGSVDSSRSLAGEISPLHLRQVRPGTKRRLTANTSTTEPMRSSTTAFAPTCVTGTRYWWARALTTNRAVAASAHRKT